jgi:hypothetical protein
MSMATPILVSGNQFRPMSRVSAENDGTDKYHEEFLQEMIDDQPNVLRRKHCKPDSDTEIAEEVREAYDFYRVYYSGQSEGRPTRA